MRSRLSIITVRTVGRVRVKGTATIHVWRASSVRGGPKYGAAIIIRPISGHRALGLPMAPLQAARADISGQVTLWPTTSASTTATRWGGAIAPTTLLGTIRPGTKHCRAPGQTALTHGCALPAGLCARRAWALKHSACGGGLTRTGGSNYGTAIGIANIGRVNSGIPGHFQVFLPLGSIYRPILYV